MSYEQCTRHDCDATNGCEGCARDRRNAAVNLGAAELLGAVRVQLEAVAELLRAHEASTSEDVFDALPVLASDIRRHEQRCREFAAGLLT